MLDQQKTLVKNSTPWIGSGSEQPEPANLSSQGTSARLRLKCRDLRRGFYLSLREPSSRELKYYARSTKVSHRGKKSNSFSVYNWANHSVRPKLSEPPKVSGRILQERLRKTSQTLLAVSQV